jgi:hypothetical protein
MSKPLALVLIINLLFLYLIDHVDLIYNYRLLVYGVFVFLWWAVDENRQVSTSTSYHDWAYREHSGKEYKKVVNDLVSCELGIIKHLLFWVVMLLILIFLSIINPEIFTIFLE